jgi:hypothetical protein
MWRRCLMVVVTFCLLWGTPARAVAPPVAYTAPISPERDYAAAVQIDDLLARCLDSLPAGARQVGGSFAIENPTDTAYLITDARFNLQGGAGAAALTLCAEGPGEALAIDTLGEEGQAALDALAGREYLPPRSVKYYRALRLSWESEFPADARLDMRLGLRPVGLQCRLLALQHGCGSRSAVGALVLLRDSEGNVADRATSDAEGRCLFAAPLPGRYTLEVYPPGGPPHGPPLRRMEVVIQPTEAHSLCIGIAPKTRF